MAPLDEVRVVAGRGFDETAWYWRLPPVAQLREEGLRLTVPVTVLVGENGSGHPAAAPLDGPESAARRARGRAARRDG